MNTVDREAGLELVRTGTLVNFQIVESEIHEGPDAAEFGVEIKLDFPPDPQSEANDLRWGAFGFVFVIGLLSFTDARPRESSALDYAEKDEFHLGDLLQCLSWEEGVFTFDADYLRGRRMKTRLLIRPDGTGQLTTIGRGKAALHWLDRLKGKKPLQLVSS